MRIKKSIVIFISIIIFFLIAYGIYNIFNSFIYSPFRIIRNETNIDFTGCHIISNDTTIKKIDDTGEVLYVLECYDDGIINSMNDWKLLPILDDISFSNDSELYNSLPGFDYGLYKVYNNGVNHVIAIYDLNSNQLFYYQKKDVK